MAELFSFSESTDGLGFGDLDDLSVGGEFASLAPSVDHVARGLANLPWQFQESENLKHLLQVILEEIQEIEEVYYEFLRQKSLDNAVGFQLDIIGEQIGKRREGITDDEEYRRLLRVQIALNTSKGQAETVIALWKYLLNTDNVSLKEEFPAGVRLYSPTSVPTREILEAVSNTLPITVNVGFVVGVTNGQPFCFLGNTGLGFSSVEGTPTGGKFVSRINL